MQKRFGVPSLGGGGAVVGDDPEPQNGYWMALMYAFLLPQHMRTESLPGTTGDCEERFEQRLLA